MIHKKLAAAAVLAISTLALAEPSEKGRAGNPADAAGGAPPAGMMIRQAQPGAFQFDPPPGAVRVAIRKQVDGDNMTTVVNEDDREITITQVEDESIKVEIREGNAEPKEYSAKDADTLKAESPEAFELYNKYCVSADQGGGLMILGDRGAGGGPHMVRAFPMHGGKIAGLDVRSEFMPNPALTAQLGEGVVVLKVKDGGRGAAIGLQEFDYIKTVNGTAVGSGDEIEAIIKDADKLTIEVLREGKTVTLAE